MLIIWFGVEMSRPIREMDGRRKEETEIANCEAELEPRVERDVLLG